MLANRICGLECSSVQSPQSVSDNPASISGSKYYSFPTKGLQTGTGQAEGAKLQILSELLGKGHFRVNACEKFTQLWPSRPQPRA